MLPTCVLFFIQLLHLNDGLPRWDDLKENEIDNEIDSFRLANEFNKKPDEETGKNVETWNENSGVNPEELGNYLEGDIMVSPRRAKNGVRDEGLIWEDGIIPYEISGRFASSDIDLIKRAMGVYQKYTCIRFVPRQSSNSDYISFTSGYTGCWSSVGRITGRQEVNLQTPSCTRKIGTVLHELMHVCGFYHEQNRPERDNYVNINFQNIKSGHERNFEKTSTDDTNDFEVPYDYRSVMHYSDHAFSRNGHPIIIAKNAKAEGKMGQRDGFSKGDLQKLNAMYKCENALPPSVPQPPVYEQGGQSGSTDFLSSFLTLFDK